ncbi:MAG: hypothetical protein Q9220_007593 [cf. Caloplaca sp. 1 TL-2023]
MLAIIGAGGRFTGSNPSYTTYELNHHIRVSHAKYLVAEPSMLATTLQSAEDCGIPEARVFTFNTKDKAPVSGQRSWTDLLEHGEAGWVTFDAPEQAASTIASLTFTSGTTGFPKAAMVSHQYAISQLKTVNLQQPPYQISRLICIPAFHAFAVPLLTGAAIREQQTTYVMRRFDLTNYLASIRQFQITDIPMVPTMLIALLTSSITNKDDLRSIRCVWVGGSPLRSLTQSDFQALLHPDAIVTQVWGMTETGWTTLFFWPESDSTGSVGRLIPGVSSKLIAEDGSVVTEDNKEGELYIKGASIMNGYFNNPSATAATMDEDGWLRTGDIAYCIQGKWYIIDRKKDIIKVHGWQVAPAELEAVLLTHPQVVNAAVIGIPLKDGSGEVPQAFIVQRPKPLDSASASDGEVEERSVTAEELKSYLALRLAKYKMLGGVSFVEDIPRTAAGKLQKFKLRELYTNLIKKGKRKSDVLETIADQNAASRLGHSEALSNVPVVKGNDIEASDHRDPDKVQVNGHASPNKRRKIIPHTAVESLSPHENGKMEKPQDEGNHGTESRSNGKV